MSLRKILSIAIPNHASRKYSETYGKCNTKAKLGQDALDLRVVIDNNEDELSRALGHNCRICHCAGPASELIMKDLPRNMDDLVATENLPLPAQAIKQ